MSTRRPGPIARALLRGPAYLYDLNAGWLLGRRFLLLTHIGRRTGRKYRTVLEVIAEDRISGELFVIAGLGQSAEWYRNLKAHGATEVAVGRQHFRPRYRELGELEAIQVLADYEGRNRWAAPVMRRVLSWLIGWRYAGSDQARRRLVAELPILALWSDDAPDPGD